MPEGKAKARTFVADRTALSPTAIRAAERHLTQSCAVMANLVATHGRCRLGERNQPPFCTLATSIMGQQLSAKAAATIRGRVESLVPRFDPQSFCATPPEILRQAGLSGAKSRSVRELAQRVIDGRLDFDEVAKLSDEAAITELTSVPGIGRWTAEMFLIFGLKRPNVLSLSDAGLRRATRLLFDNQTELAIVGERWQPYCSVASWYLWRYLDAEL